ncbi:hypothetical protein [Actinoplanes sp. NPDC051411]|jgi:hypothetical protein|uniref:hypothetical protein n=1 Tax=Actinoplanes sp. NPDC051411 TaxID=3155522 RepID=UPI00341F003B
MNRIVRTSLVATTVLGVALGVAGPAAAAAPAAAPVGGRQAAKPLDVAKKAVTDRIDLRLAALKKFSDALAGAKEVQSGHRSTLTSLIGQQTTDLTTLKGKVGTETTAAAVRTDAKAMVDDFRVFILTGPKVRLTAAIDTEQVAAGKLGTKATPVKAGLDGKVDTLLAIKPGPDGNAIRAQVKTIRDAAKTARTSLKAVRKQSK